MDVRRGRRDSLSKISGFWENFKQQNNKAWVLEYTTSFISPILIGIGALLIPLGVAVLIISTDSSTDIKEFRIDYTYCSNVKNASETCASYIKSPEIWTKNLEMCRCDVDFELPKQMKGEKIYMYYRLENFYQNLRQYVKSRDDKQLTGELGTVDNPKKPEKDCEPFHEDDQGRIIYPCGAIANSLFNDSIQLYYIDDDLGEIEIKQKRKGIAWASDKKYRYKNPSQFANRNDPIWEKYTKPKDWNRTIWDLDPEDPENNGVQNEDLIVWMRPAALNNFQKLYRIIESSSQNILETGLPAGKYKLRINYTYEVTSFRGSKAITLTSPTIFGQQNLSQAISAISMGGIYVVTGLLLFLCGCKTRHGKGFFKERGFDTDMLY